MKKKITIVVAALALLASIYLVHQGFCDSITFDGTKSTLWGGDLVRSLYFWGGIVAYLAMGIALRFGGYLRPKAG